MTVFTLFDAQLFVLYTAVGHLGLVLACGATAALAFLVRQRWWAGWGGARRLASWVGAGLAAATGAALVLGLRVHGTAFDAATPALLWEWLAAAGAGAGLVAAVYAAGSTGAGALAFAAERRRALGPVPAPLDEVGAAVAAYQSLQAAVARLRLAEQEAAEKGRAVADGVAAAEYERAASAIRTRLQLAEELQATAGVAVIRLACKAPVRRLLERRPDQVLARLNEQGHAPLGPRVDAALAAVRTFMRELATARAELQRELSGAPGSVAQRLALDAGERALPFEAALAEIEATYGRVGHRLEALRMRVGAEADAGSAASAAMDLAGKAPVSAATDLVEVALEMAQADQSAATALGALGSEPTRRLTDVVVRVSAELARDSTDDEALADVIRSVRRELQ